MHNDIRADRDDRYAARRSVHSAMTIAIGVASGILLAIAAVVAFVMWGTYQAERDARAYLQQLQQQQRLTQQREQQALEQRRAAEAQLQREREQQIRTQLDLERRKAEAWANFYRKPAHCDNPAPHEVVECGNHHIRARRQFDELFAQGKL